MRGKRRWLLVAVAAALSVLMYAGHRRRARPIVIAGGGDDSALAALCDTAPVPLRAWRGIVIHHSATSEGNAERFDRYHREVRGWRGGLGYHFVIGNGRGAGDGEIEVGPRWVEQIPGPHAGVAEINEHYLAICLVGNFEEDRPTARQIVALVALVHYLQQRLDIPLDEVRLHRDVRDGATLCPGRNFPLDEVRRRLRALSRRDEAPTR